MLPERLRYLAIEGPIGAGKTSLARAIAARLPARLLLEDPDANPFLARFYQDPERYALATQLFFLFQRVNHLSGTNQEDLLAGRTVADFILDKDPLFAQLTLTNEELALYQGIYGHLKPRAPSPDLVIYLKASPETLMERVRRRGVGYETGLTEDYLRRLADAYSRFFHHYDAAPVLIVNSDNLNFVDERADLDLLLARVAEMRGSRAFFNLGN
ncbi:MAG: deoxynucleoside kinase [Burkholderiales bacterium]